MKTVESEAMCCPRCGTLDYQDNGETEPVVIRYACRRCGQRWTWHTTTFVQRYANGNTGLSSSRKFLIRE